MVRLRLLYPLRDQGVGQVQVPSHRGHLLSFVQDQPDCARPELVAEATSLPLLLLVRFHGTPLLASKGVHQIGASPACRKEVVVYSDIDLPFDLEEVWRALYLLDFLEADAICGFRLDRTSEGLKRQVYTSVYNFMIRSLFGVRVRDINFSFKVFRRRVLDSISIESSGSFIDAELVVKAIRSGYRVFQFGVDYFPRTYGESSLASLSVIKKMIVDLVRLYPATRHPKLVNAAGRVALEDVSVGLAGQDNLLKRA